MEDWPAGRALTAQGELQRAVREGVVPGMVAAAGIHDEVLGTWCIGAACTVSGDERPMQQHTVFDLASLTKVTATLPCVLKLVASGAIDLDAPVQRYLGRFREGSVTVRQLLTHTSGLPESPPLYQTVSGRREMADALYQVAVAAPAGSQVMYSDIGFAFLGLLVEQVAGSGLEQVANEWVFQPLGMSALFAPPLSWRDRCAATEVVDGRAVIGRVHDENADAAGGVSGHAGLFATVSDMQRYAQLWIDDSLAILPTEVRREATRCQTDDLAGAHRGLGWVCRGDSADFLSPGWGSGAVCHTGFTGTSLAVDPASGRWAVLLSNAVHFGRGRSAAVRSMREGFHAALVGDPSSTD